MLLAEPLTDISDNGCLTINTELGLFTSQNIQHLNI